MIQVSVDDNGCYAPFSKAQHLLLVPTFEVHRRFVPDPNRIPAGHIADPANWPEKRILDELNKIRGHLVIFPTDYLCRDNMLASIVQEAVPPIVFT